MPSWVVTGASRGIGLEFVKQLSDESQNVVFALVRSPPNAELAGLAASRANVHIVMADIAHHESVGRAASKVGELTGGKLDVLINNACHPGLPSKFYPTSTFLGKEAELQEEIGASVGVNVLGTMYCINHFLPLIRKGEHKKIIYITSGSGDMGFTRQVGVTATVGYGMSKAGMMLVMAKYAAELEVEGIKTLSLSPGWVATDLTRGLLTSPEILDVALKMMQKANPDVKGMMSPEESVRMQLKVIEGLTMEQSGMVLSHHGDENNWV
ncbi:putative short-chain dehydrogenase [Stachybotrys elegans]|uniref:Short-chain dehydrogenase n=1 Tax=Stachybotrys elegans TaxID=80388 RepID=A0A8K0SGU6_9HYPO|nr:putative short-chain dehydrogenase [Stachybotrys elegans]